MRPEQAWRKHSRSGKRSCFDRRKSRPDWPALRQSLAEAIEDISIARSQAEEEIKNYEQLNAEFEATRRAAEPRLCACSPAIRKTDWRPTSITRRRPTHSTGSPW